MEAVGLTKRQIETLDFIHRFIEEHRWAPSYTEIMEGMHWKTKSIAHIVVESLVKRGYLINQPNRSRSIAVIKLPPGYRPAVPEGDASPDIPPSLNMARYRKYAELIARNYVLVCGDAPDAQEDKALNQFAAALVARPDDRSVAKRLRRIGSIMVNAAAELDRISEAPSF
jgi:SOS-response transcriptional repressor LexA